MKKEAFLIAIIGALLLIQPLMAQTWTATKRLTWNSGNSYRPIIAIDSNNHLHMVWYDLTPPSREIFYKKSTDEGTTWTTRRLTFNPGESYSPNIAVDSNDHLHMVWMDEPAANLEIHYKKSTNGGTTWTTKRLTFNSGDSREPKIAIDSSDRIHVVWRDLTPGYSDIYYKKSTDGGTNWTTKRLTQSAGFSRHPEIALDSNNHIHVVFYDNAPGNYEIYYKKSIDGGATWTGKRLTWNSAFSGDPVVAINSNDHLYVVFEDETPGQPDIYYKKSTNGGTSWTTKQLTYSDHRSKYPDISVDSNDRVHVVWNDFTPGNDEIFYKRSTDGGTTWTQKRLTYTSSNSYEASVVIDSNNRIHVAWNDSPAGNSEIYYKKGIQ